MSIDNSEPTDEEIIAALTELTPFEYDRQRIGKAKKLGIQVKTLDAAVAKRRPDKELKDGSGQPVKFDDVTPFDGDVIGCEVLDEALNHLTRHMHMDYHEAVCCALWVAHTYMFKRFSHTPRVVISAPEPQCGKTVLLHHLLGSMVNKRLTADNISPPVFFRIVETHKPTFMIDEVDAWLKEDTDLISSLNSGFEPQGQVLRCVGDDHEVRGFSTHAPVAMSGIQIETKLPSATLDRAILVTLERAQGDISKTDAFKTKHHASAIKITGSKIAKWMTDAEEQIAATNPTMPDALINRGEDKWSPLFAIAEVAGSSWPERIRAAFFASIKVAPPTKSELFLMDLAEVVPPKGDIYTTTLIDKLCELDDSRYIEYNFKVFETNKKRIQPRQIALALSKYKLTAERLRIGSGDNQTRQRGYNGDKLRAVLCRYLPDPVDAAMDTGTDTRARSTPQDSICPSVPTASDGPLSDNGSVPTDDLGTDRKTLKPAPHKAWDTGTDKNPEYAQGGKASDSSGASPARELSPEDEAAVRAWAESTGETDAGKIQYTLEKCATNPGTLNWILGGGEQVALKKTNGNTAEVQPTESLARKRLGLARTAGAIFTVNDGQLVYTEQWPIGSDWQQFIAANESDLLQALADESAGKG